MASIVVLGSCFIAYKARKSYKKHKAEKMTIDYPNDKQTSSRSYMPLRNISTPAVHNVGVYNNTASGKLPEYSEATSQAASRDHRTGLDAASSKVAA